MPGVSDCHMINTINTRPPFPLSPGVQALPGHCVGPTPKLMFLGNGRQRLDGNAFVPSVTLFLHHSLYALLELLIVFRNIRCGELYHRLLLLRETDCSWKGKRETSPASIPTITNQSPSHLGRTLEEPQNPSLTLPSVRLLNSPSDTDFPFPRRAVGVASRHPRHRPDRHAVAVTPCCRDTLSHVRVTASHADTTPRRQTGPGHEKSISQTAAAHTEWSLCENMSSVRHGGDTS
ncbi:hypothetical protein DPEC_G00283900 [Dallia pectoralis]|uniref:Uncharacterized protein n=1 Tax=Dallia pectoralis TaxID=75939 RepID=A0ACC2FJG1_DALPE|nr:hypothetical protein DPEC_G00283900 [Dallia pectoralis]